MEATALVVAEDDRVSQSRGQSVVLSVIVYKLGDAASTWGLDLLGRHGGEVQWLDKAWSEGACYSMLVCSFTAVSLP